MSRGDLQLETMTMKSGKTIEELAVELTRQRDSKRDFIADTRRMSMTDDARAIAIDGVGQFPLLDHARRQLATKLDVPAAFFERLQSKHPDLLASMTNQLLVREPQQTMVRTLDGFARGILSDAFRPLDNYDLVDATLPALLDVGAHVESCEVTATRLYIKASLPTLDRVLPMPEGAVMGVGHTIFPRALRGAIVIRNSEVGMGALSISPAILEKQCTNLAVFKDDGFGVMHLGKRKGEDDGVREYLTDATKRLDDASVWAKTRDIIAAICSGRVMDKLIAQMSEARADAITGNPAAVVELFGKRNQLTEDERGGLLRHLIASGEKTRYGLQWAVTRLAGDAADYDRASDLERLGGKVIELPKSEWKELLKAA
jgi:hypothetical protein